MSALDAAAPSLDALVAALEASWPPARSEISDEGLVLREDAVAAGSRVRSARPISAEAIKDPAAAADRIAAFYGARGAPALYQQAFLSRQRPGDPLVDALQARGFEPFDATAILGAPIAALAARPPGEAAEPTIRIIDIQTPLACLDAIWLEGGVGAERQTIMRRALAAHPGGVLALRIGSRLKGAAFWAAPAALANQRRIAFLHALYVSPEARRSGGADALLRRAAEAAQGVGAAWLCAATVERNKAAISLFESRGLRKLGGYVYWRSQR